MRLDVPACAAAPGLTHDGPCAGGEIGAGYVVLPDGRRADLTAGWAHMALRRVDWSIRHHTPAEAGARLTLAERPRRW